MKDNNKKRGRSIEELERELYRRHKKPSLPKKDESFKESKRFEAGPTEPFSKEPEVDISNFGKKRFTWLLVSAIIVAFLIAVFVFWRGFFAFTEKRVDINIEAPDNIIAGEEVTWLVEVANNNRSALEAGELIFRFPRNSSDSETGKLLSRVTRDMGFLESGEKREEEFKAVVVGGDNFERNAQAFFRFKPVESSLVLASEEKHTLNIEKFPVEISINGPDETLSSQDIEVGFRLENDSDKVFNNLRLRIEYPSGFRFKNSRYPLKESNAIWPLEQILSSEKIENVITGEVSGLEGESKIFRAFLEYNEPTGWQVYKESSFRSNLAVLPLTLSVRLDDEVRGSVDLGKELSYEISWRNNFDVPLSALTLRAVLEGDLFDMKTLKTNGSVNAVEKTIIWSSSQLSSLGVLRPGAEGVVTFRIKTKPSFPLSVLNPTINIRSEIESETKPAGLTVDKVQSVISHETKINGAVSLDSFAYYHEPSGLITNSGPYPLKVGSPTTFTVHWKLAGFANNFEDVVVKAVLPSGISWQDQSLVRGSVGEVSYNSFSREVLWEIDKLTANQGRRSSLEAIFKIGVTPSPSQSGHVIPLLSEVQVVADDSFTDNQFSLVIDEIDSRIPNDWAGGGATGRVTE